MDPPDRSGPDAGQQNPAADAAPGGGVLEARVQGADLLYHFAGGTAGQTVLADLSGQVPPVDLAISDPLAITWNLNSASIVAPVVLANPTPASRVRDACALSGAFTMEAWVRTGDLEQNGTIAALAESANVVSLTTRQEGPDYYTYLRTSATPLDGTQNPAFNRGPIDAVNVQHYVYTRILTNGTQNVYLNGVAVPPPQDQAGATGVWPANSYFAIAADIDQLQPLTPANPWLGEVALVAVYCRDLSEAEILQNYTAGF